VYYIQRWRHHFKKVGEQGTDSRAKKFLTATMLKVYLCALLYLPLHLHEPLYLHGVVLLPCGPFTRRAFRYDMGPFHPREAPSGRGIRGWSAPALPTKHHRK